MAQLGSRALDVTQGGELVVEMFVSNRRWNLRVTLCGPGIPN